MMEDILLYGVPAEMDTGANESHHKLAKQAAKVTQRKRSTFDIQVAKRLYEYLLLDLAWEEIMFGRVKWRYYHGYRKQSHDIDIMSDSLDSMEETFESMDISAGNFDEGSSSGHRRKSAF